MLELESYLLPQTSSRISSTLSLEDESAPVSVDLIDKVTQLMRVVEKLAEQVEKLQQNVADVECRTLRMGDDERQPKRESPPRRRRRFIEECWNCQQTGHISRYCPHPRSQPRSQHEQQETRHPRHGEPSVGR